jgi:hypothetical protein
MNYTWDNLRKIIKGTETPPAKAMNETISQANNFIKQMRQNLQNNKK